MFHSCLTVLNGHFSTRFILIQSWEKWRGLAYDASLLSTSLLGYIVAQSASLYALLFVIINIYSVYSVYSVLGILTLFRDICYINKFVFRSVRKSNVPPYLKYLLLRDKGWCMFTSCQNSWTHFSFYQQTFAGQ